VASPALLEIEKRIKDRSRKKKLHKAADAVPV
jgi:hypothetical protein